MTEVLIGGIKASAPLWNKAPEADLLAIVESLSRASYHYADDSGKEWGKAGSCIATASAECNRLSLSFSAITAIHRHKPQLVSLGDFTDAVLRDARKATKGNLS